MQPQPVIKEKNNIIPLYEDNIIHLKKEDPIKLKKDGTPDKRWGVSNKPRNDNGEIDGAKKMSCLYTQDEIRMIYNKYVEKVEIATAYYQEKMARRNLCMFVCSINVGLRGGDFCKLTFKDIFDYNWDFKIDHEKMTQKRNKNAKIDFNFDFQSAILCYVDWLKSYGYIPKLDDYIFTSRKGGYLGRQEWWKINSTTCKEVGITRPIGTHGLRKTFAHSFIENGENESDDMENLSRMLGQSNVRVTREYACKNNESINKIVNKMAFIY